MPLPVKTEAKTEAAKTASDHRILRTWRRLVVTLSEMTKHMQHVWFLLEKELLSVRCSLLLKMMPTNVMTGLGVAIGKVTPSAALMPLVNMWETRRQNVVRPNCEHQHLKNYGNRHGSFKKCEDCDMTWKKETIGKNIEWLPMEKKVKVKKEELTVKKEELPEKPPDKEKEVTCGKCQTKNPKLAIHCLHCGTRIAAEVPVPMEEENVQRKRGSADRNGGSISSNESVELMPDLLYASPPFIP
jgi:hypothetical protein